ncbi:MAG TPA: hydrogenase accessory protein HypB [Candidatus Thorarchaeota archaeon]|nr:MAG: hydrogenase accessory protein HypB [Candidatus Thorarchaeota archaeon]RLI61851.1 MAG: hydrogenase accessory protein HypB [Candidatus Thorarchaeota archaeon]HDD67531.1 hydrogenase accessory protein HypB [Candidatus Thorarchaeota archaeon]
MTDKTITIDVRKDLFGANEEAAAINASIFEQHGIRAIDVMGSVGTGKTMLIETLCERLADKYRILMVAGDLATTIDADRVASHGVDTVQINTQTACHLDARMVRVALKKVDLSKYDLVFIENVGNLICPAGYPLGAEKKIVVVSITEGPYMIRKHPLTIKRSDMVVINKVDLAEALEFDVDSLVRDIREIDATLPVVRVSAKTGEGVDELIRVLDL